MASDLVERPYLIRKQGYWYRPNASGYTDSAIQAGRYSLEEAECYTHPNGKNGPRDGMDYVHEKDVPCPDLKALRKAADRITHQEAVIAVLVDAMKHIANMEPHPELIARAALAKAKESRDV